ncbi:MAG: hypothetical protein AVDCRST_MAG79-1812, partial [uncultured Thermoleophilia bacterium]
GRRVRSPGPRDPQVLRRRRGPPVGGPRRPGRLGACPARGERCRQVDAGQDPRRGPQAGRRRDPGRRQGVRRAGSDPGQGARRPDDLPGAQRRARPDGRREHLPGPVADPARHRGVARPARPRSRRARRPRGGHRSRRPGLVPADRRAAGRGDRPGHVRPGSLPDPRRADGGALGPGGRSALRGGRPAAQQRRRARLHHPPPGRGRPGRRPCRGPPGRCRRPGARRRRDDARGPGDGDDRAHHGGRRPPAGTGPGRPADGPPPAGLRGRRQRGRLPQRRHRGALGRDRRAVREAGVGHRRSGRECLRAAAGRSRRMPARRRAPRAAGATCRDRRRRRLPAGRSPERRRLHGPLRRGEHVHPLLASHEQARDPAPLVGGDRLSPVARPAGHPVTQRARPAHRDALRRQPAEGPARALARAGLPGPGARGADARRRRGRPPRDLRRDPAAGPRGDGGPRGHVGLRGGRPARRSLSRHGPRKDRRPSRGRRDHHQATHGARRRM